MDKSKQSNMHFSLQKQISMYTAISIRIRTKYSWCCKRFFASVDCLPNWGIMKMIDSKTTA